MKVADVEKIVEILSDMRADYNCFDPDERDMYHMLSYAIARINEVPQYWIEVEEDE